MPAGRPTKFCPEVCDRILEYVRLGVFLKVAAKASGVTTKTVYSWLKRGQRTGAADAEFREFRSAYMVAQAEGRLELEKCALSAGRMDGKQALEVLARRWPDDWGSERGELRKLRKMVEELAKKLEGGKANGQQ